MEQGVGGVWVAMTVAPLKERLACIWLSNIKIRHTLPMEVRLVRRSRYQKAKPKPIYRPAMRGYVFLWIPGGSDEAITDHIDRARKFYPIKRPVGVRGRPLVLRQHAWEARLNPDAMDPDGVNPRPEAPPKPIISLVAGERVRLTEAAGAWRGYHGRVDNLSRDEVKLAIEGLETALASMTVPAGWVEKLAA